VFPDSFVSGSLVYDPGQFSGTLSGKQIRNHFRDQTLFISGYGLGLDTVFGAYTGYAFMEWCVVLVPGSKGFCGFT